MFRAGAHLPGTDALGARSDRREGFSSQQPRRRSGREVRREFTVSSRAVRAVKSTLAVPVDTALMASVAAGSKKSAARRGAMRLDAHEEILPRLRALNARLRASGCPLRVPRPRAGNDADRERVSRALMVVVREQGGGDALELLYLLNHRVLLAFCRAKARTLASKADADDAVAETFLTLLTKASMFRPTAHSSFTGWMFVIAANILRQWQRKRRHEPDVDASLVREPEAAGDEPWALVTASEACDAHARALDLFVRLAAAGLARLPPRWRRALEMRESEGRSYREIGAALNLSQNHAGMVIRRARLRVLNVVAAALRGETRRSS